MVFHASRSPKVSPIPLIQGGFQINDITSFQSSPKNNPRKSSKFATLKVISTPLRKSIARFFTLCYCCLKFLRKPPTNMEIIRIKDTLRNRTKFKSLKGIKDFHAYLIDDLAVVRKKWTVLQTNLSYASCGFLRRLMRSIRKRFRKFRKVFKKFKGK